MLYSAAYAYVGRALSRGTDTDRTNDAKDSISTAIEEWNLRRVWNFLRMDTRNGFSVGTCTVASLGATHATNGFIGVNVGQTVTSSNAGDFVTGGTSRTITAVAADGSSITWAVAADGTGSARTLTFSADIPVVTGTDLYNLPTVVRSVYSARLQTNNVTLKYISMRENDRRFPYQTSSTNQVPIYYNNFNDVSFTTLKQYGKIRLLPVPGVDDTLRVRYHRLISQPSVDGDLIDMPSHYVYAMLTLARYYFLVSYNAENARTGEMKERAEFLFKRAVLDDKSITADKDTRMIPFNEWGGDTLYKGEDELEMPL